MSNIVYLCFDTSVRKHAKLMSNAYTSISYGHVILATSGYQEMVQRHNVEEYDLHNFNLVKPRAFYAPEK